MINKRKLKKILIISLAIIVLLVCCTISVFLFLPDYAYAGLLLFCYDWGQDAVATMKYYCLPAPSSNQWITCNKTKEVWRYLKKEKVQKIAFGSDEILPDDYAWQITNPEQIKQTLHLINAADNACNISIVWMGRMSIITDKHKFLVPIEIGDQAVYGIDWTSKQLRKELWKWGFDNKIYQYDFPSKEQTVAILLYPLKRSPPLALFGDKNTVEDLIFNPKIKEEPNGIIGIVDLYKFTRICQFGIETKKEGRKIIHSNEIKPKILFVGRDKLEKIMDVYGVTFKEAEETEKYFPMTIDNPVGRIVFMTKDGDYWKEIGIENNAVYDDYIKSEQLKAYFDELGLTKELLSSK